MTIQVPSFVLRVSHEDPFHPQCYLIFLKVTLWGHKTSFWKIPIFSRIVYKLAIHQFTYQFVNICFLLAQAGYWVGPWHSAKCSWTVSPDSAWTPHSGWINDVTWIKYLNATPLNLSLLWGEAITFLFKHFYSVLIIILWLTRLHKSIVSNKKYPESDHKAINIFLFLFCLSILIFEWVFFIMIFLDKDLRIWKASKSQKLRPSNALLRNKHSPLTQCYWFGI